MHRNQLGVKFMNGKKNVEENRGRKNETFGVIFQHCAIYDRYKHLLKVLITDITKVFIQS